MAVGLSDGGQQVGPVANALEIQTVTLQFAVDNGQEADDEATRIGGKHGHGSTGEAPGPGGDGRGSEHAMNAVVIATGDLQM